MPRTIGGHGWIEAYSKAVARYTSSPDNYHKWVAATAISATLKRKVWISRGTWRMCPNIFTCLVGRPGIGKGEAIEPAIKALRKANTANILSDRLTIEWIKEQLSKGFGNAQPSAGGGISFGPDSSCILVAPELSVFLRFPEDELPDLADMWDAKSGPSMYGTRSKGLVTIESPCPSMLAGCAPEWLKDAIPPSAIGGGFTRRVNFIYASDPKLDNPWPDSVDWDLIVNPLVNDLRCIAQLRGEYKFDNLARPVFEKIFKERLDDFTDEATTHYTTSRWANAAKLAMCLAAAKYDDLVITKEVLEEADAWTMQVKNELKIVFRSVGSSDMMVAADKILKYIESVGTCTIQQLMSAVWRDCSRNELDVILITLRDAEMVMDRHIGGKSVLSVGKRFVQQQMAMQGQKSKAARYGIN